LTFSGQHYRIANLDGQPKPLQRPHPPIFIGGGAKRLLSFAGQAADIVGILCRATPDGGLDRTEETHACITEKIEWVKQAAGDRFDDLELAALIWEVAVTDNPRAAAEAIAARRSRTVDQVLESVIRYQCEAAHVAAARLKSGEPRSAQACRREPDRCEGMVLMLQDGHHHVIHPASVDECALAVDLQGPGRQYWQRLLRVSNVGKNGSEHHGRGDTQPNGSGRYNGNVTAHSTCSDALSGVASCPADQVLSTEGSAVNSTAASAAEVAGNTAPSSVVTVKIDKTAPVVTGGTPTGVGSFTATCSGTTDNAGNTTPPVSATYTVNYTLSAFMAPVKNPTTINTVKAGRAYPIKFQLTNASGRFITNLAAVKSITYQSTSCASFMSNPSDPRQTTATGNSGLQYDSAANQFIHVWATPSAPGCYILFVSLDSGQVFPANFNPS
jgi:hypothetical protein